MKKASIQTIAILSLLLLSTLATAKPNEVDYIEVDLQFSDSLVPGLLTQRIRSSVQQVAERALLGKSIDEASGLKDSLVEVMKKIFNDVLEGFTIDNLALDVGRTTTVSVKLTPNEPRVRELSIVVKAPGLHSMWHPVFQGITDELVEVCLPHVKGMPVKSKSWATKLYLDILNSTPQFQDLYPGFQIIPTAEFAEKTVVTLTLKAKEPTIRWVTVKVRSRTIPTLALERMKYAVAAESDVLLGLPVEFASLQTENITKEAIERFAQTGISKSLGLIFQVTLVPGKVSAVAVRVESTKYRGFVKGKVSIGREERDPDIKGHIGMFLGPNVETFLETNFFPGPPDLQANIGIGLRLGQNLFGAIGKNFIDGVHRTWVEYYVTDDVTFAFEKGVEEDIDNKSEASVRLQLFDFYALELVTDLHRDIWIRIVANL
ncbi:MAG: hypothetical protein ABIH66_01810 [bacterium]